MDFKAVFTALVAWLYARLYAFVELMADEHPTKAGRRQFRTLALTSPKPERAQAGNLVALVIGIAVAVIVGVGVAIPIVNDVIASSNLSGLTATIVGFIPVMLGVLIFVATVGPIMRRT